MNFGDLAYPDVEALRSDDRTTVLLLPLGATEPHGPHGPLATDTIISVEICERAAKRFADDPDVRALVLPPVAYGVTRYAAGFAGTITIGEATLLALVVDVVASLARQGLPRVVLVNSHFEPEQVETLRAAVEAADDCVRLLDLTRRANAERLTDEFRSGAGHAGRYETSLVLAAAPELVRAERMTELPGKPLDMPAEIRAGRTDFVAMGMDRAYCGSPADATAEEGEQTFETLVEMTIEVVREVARC